MEDVKNIKQIDPKYTGGDLQEARKFVLSHIFQQKSSDHFTQTSAKTFLPDQAKLGIRQ
jgi:hypothetical protein